MEQYVEFFIKGCEEYMLAQFILQWCKSLIAALNEYSNNILAFLLFYCSAFLSVGTRNRTKFKYQHITLIISYRSNYVHFNILT